MKQLSFKDFFEKCKDSLDLQLIAGSEGWNKKFRKVCIERPGLCLAGHFSHFPKNALLVFGKRELSYIKELSFDSLSKRLEQMAPIAIIFGEGCLPIQKISQFCEKKGLPLFLSSKSCEEILGRSFSFFEELLSPSISLSGTLVEVFGMGVLIQGESSVGKSFSALCLLDRGHRLISDDLVFIRRRHWKELVGFSSAWSPPLMEIRGVGLVDVAHLLGVAKVKMEQTIDLVLRLEPSKENRSYNPLEAEENSIEFLGLSLPLYTLNVSSSSFPLLIELLVANHRLKQMGIHTAKKFSAKLLKEIQQKGLLHEDCASS